jgi:hypothetical protein
MNHDKAEAPKLAPRWHFNYDKLEGYVHGGHEHGVEFTCGVDGRPVTAAMCLNLEHYFALGRDHGLFVPRYKASVHTHEEKDGSIQVEIEPFEEWKVRSTITYKLLPQRIIEARFEFSFDESYRGFEALISNYFLDATEPYLHLGGSWEQPRLTDGEHRCWPSDEGAAQRIAELQSYPSATQIQNQVELPIDSKSFDYPIMVTPVGNTGWCVINIVEPAMCVSLSANRKWKAHDFSLIGRDVAARESVSCRSWMAYYPLELTDHQSLDAAIDLYHELMVFSST